MIYGAELARTGKKKPHSQDGEQGKKAAVLML